VVQGRSPGQRRSGSLDAALSPTGYYAARIFPIALSNAFPISVVDGESPVNNSKASAAW
jgi:hypothetical protein